MAFIFTLDPTTTTTTTALLLLLLLLPLPYGPSDSIKCLVSLQATVVAAAVMAYAVYTCWT